MNMQHNGEPPVRELLADAVESLGELVELHVALAKAEVTRDLKGFVTDIVMIVAGLPLLAVGYLLLCVAGAWAISPWVTVAGGFAILALVNLVAGGIAVAVGMRKLKKAKIDLTVGREIKQSTREVMPKAPADNAAANKDEVLLVG